MLYKHDQKGYAVEIKLGYIMVKTPVVDLKSILALMSLAVPYGQNVKIVARGSETLKKLLKMFLNSRIKIMKRIPIIAGNWKMYKTKDDALAFIYAVNVKVPDKKNVESVICAPAIFLRDLVKREGENLRIGSQKHA